MNRHVRWPMALLTAAAILSAAWWSEGCGAATSKPAASAPASAPTSASAPAVRAVHVLVSGKVQGVGYRDWTVVRAGELKLTGWVRNLTDKRVEAVVEGPAEAVAALLEKMKKGPPAASVTDVKFTEEKPTGKLKDFERLPNAAGPS